MSAEFILTFQDDTWYEKNRNELKKKMTDMASFARLNGDDYEFIGSEAGGDLEYDARLFLEETSIFIEISTHPPSIEKDLSSLFQWIGNQTEIYIRDEDGEDSGWI